jgi:hypothetical protein
MILASTSKTTSLFQRAKARFSHFGKSRTFVLRSKCNTLRVFHFALHPKEPLALRGCLPLRKLSLHKGRSRSLALDVQMIWALYLSRLTRFN